MKHYFSQLAEGAGWKTTSSILMSMLMVIQGFYGELLWAFLGILVIDSITGIMKSKKQGIPVCSRRLRDTVNKVGAYMLLLTCVIIISKVENSFTALVNPVYWYFIFTESKSILENVQALGVTIPVFLNDAVSSRIKEDEAVHKKQ